MIILEVLHHIINCTSKTPTFEKVPKFVNCVELVFKIASFSVFKGLSGLAIERVHDN